MVEEDTFRPRLLLLAPPQPTPSLMGLLCPSYTGKSAAKLTFEAHISFSTGIFEA